jgi:hypothetical protein
MKSIKSFSQFITEEAEGVTPEEQKKLARLKLDADAAAFAAKTADALAPSPAPASTTPTTTLAPTTPVAKVDITTVYNSAIGSVTDLQSQNKIGSVDAVAAKAWLIFNRDLAKVPANQSNIEILSKNYPTGVASATKVLNIVKKLSSTTTLPADTINIGVDYTGATVTAEQSNFGIGSSANYTISFTRTSDKKP